MTTEDAPETLTPEIAEAAEAIFDGWFADTERIDWENFIDRLEDSVDLDFGSDGDSRLIRAVKAHVRTYRKLG